MSLGLAGRRLLVASSHCFVLQSWLAECFLSFLYYRRGLGLGPGAAQGCPGLPGATEGLLVQRVFGWTQSNTVGNQKQQQSLGVLGAPSNPSIYSLHRPPSFVSGPGGGEHGELSSAGIIKIILNPLIFQKCHIGWEAAIPGHLADVPSLNLLEQSLSLFGRVLSKLL